MADLHAVCSFEDEIDQPPGTFKLIQGILFSYLWVASTEILIHSDDETDEHGQRIVVLDPIPSSDPNEPLVGGSSNFTSQILNLYMNHRTGAQPANQSTSPLFWL
jgi:hypothetical protein